MSPTSPIPIPRPRVTAFQSSCPDNLQSATSFAIDGPSLYERSHPAVQRERAPTALHCTYRDSHHVPLFDPNSPVLSFSLPPLHAENMIQSGAACTQTASRRCGSHVYSNVVTRTRSSNVDTVVYRRDTLSERDEYPDRNPQARFAAPNTPDYLGRDQYRTCERCSKQYLAADEYRHRQRCTGQGTARVPSSVYDPMDMDRDNFMPALPANRPSTGGHSTPLYPVFRYPAMPRPPGLDDVIAKYEDERLGRQVQRRNRNSWDSPVRPQGVYR